MLSLWQVTRALFEGPSRLLVAQLRALGDDGGAPEDGLTVDDAPVYQQLGVAVRPLVTRSLRALGYEHGDEVAVLKVWDKAASPTDLEAGETRLYAAGAITRVVRLLTGRIDVEAPEIRLGTGASKRVARSGDPVRVVIPAGTVLNGTIAGSPASFTVGPGGITCDGTVTDGSSTVLAKD